LTVRRCQQRIQRANDVLWAKEAKQQLIEEACWDGWERAQAEYWAEIAQAYDPWDHVSKETMADIESGKLKVKNLSKWDVAKLATKSKRELAERQAKAQRAEVQRDVQEAIESHDEGLHDLYDRLADLQSEVDELKQQITDLEGEVLHSRQP
jgi:chromosome segregation ATPase